MMKSSSPSQKGFTLVELAIVMIIIGLLIGGILKGQQLIYNSRIKSVATQLQGIQAAQNIFRDTYKALPGDLPRATQRLTTCGPANFCVNGNGDGLVGVRLNQSTGATGSENIQYWKHLAMADLINGVIPSADPDPTTLAWGVTNPSTTMGGGMNALMMVSPLEVGTGPGDFGGRGVIIMLTATPGTTTWFLTPQDARAIDLILDDGGPNSGIVTAEYATSSFCDVDAPGNNYRLDITTPQCILYLNIE